MNTRRGLNRIYIVLWVLWGLLCLWYPNYYHSKQYISWLSMSSEFEKECHERRGKECRVEYDERSKQVKTDEDEQRSRQLLMVCYNARAKQCYEEQKASDKKDKDVLFPANKNAYEWMEPDHPYLLLTAAVVVPPAVLYGILFGLFKLFSWIVGGFANNPK